MTLTTTSSRKDYTGNGTIVVFAYDFLITASADLGVYLDGVKKTLTTDYTVSGAGVPTGGNVTFVVAPGNGVAIAIVREVAYTQGVAYVENQKFPAATHESALDRLTMLCQQLLEKVGRAATFKVQSLLTNPVMADGAVGKVLRWKTTTELENIDIATVGAIPLPVVPASGGTGSNNATGYTKAGLPAAGSPGRLARVTDDVGGLWVDTGIAWQLIGPTAFAAGSVVFAGANGSLTQNNPTLFWDNTNSRLGLRTATPNETLSVVGTMSGIGTTTVTRLGPIIGNEGFSVLTTNFFEPTAQAGLHFGSVFQIRGTAGPTGTLGAKVAIFAGGESGTGGVNVVTGNFVIQRRLGDAAAQLNGLEIDVNNNAADDTVAAVPAMQGLVVMTAGSFMPRSGIYIARTGTSKWRNALEIDAAAINDAGLKVGNPTNGLTGTALFRQLTNAGDALLLQRVTDTGPTGGMIRIVNAANTLELFRLHADGTLQLGGTILTGSGPQDLLLQNQKAIRGFNAAGTSYVGLIYLDGSDRVALAGGGVNDILWGKPLVALGGGVAPTLGTIGGAGPAAAAQNSWMRVIDSTGVAFWVPAWK